MEKLLKMMVQNSRQSGRPSLENSQSAGKWSATLARKRNLSEKKKRVKDLWKLRKWKHLWFFGLRILGHKEDKLWFNDSGSISFQSPPETFFSFASLLFCSLLCRGNQTHHSFPPRYISHFVIMDFLRNRTGKQVYMKLGTLMLRGIDLHKLSSPNSSAVRLGWVCSNILGAAGGWWLMAR